MSRTPICLPPLDVADHSAHPTSLRWLTTPGSACRARQPVACCWVSVRPKTPRAERLLPGEWRDLQVVLATPHAGRFVPNADLRDDGGWAPLLPSFDRKWQPGAVVGHVEGEAGEEPAEALLLFLAGQRVVEFADVRGLIMTGWHRRVRGWWQPAASSTPTSTLTSLGVCELQGVMRGEEGGFFDWYERLPGPTQIVHFPDHLIVPAAPVLCSQWEQTAEDRAAITADLLRYFQALGGPRDSPTDAAGAAELLDDLPVAAHFLSAAARAPSLVPPILRDGALRECSGARAVVLSLHSEGALILRHRRLGYVLAMHRYRIADLSPTLRTWLSSDFEPVVRTVDQVKQDLRDCVERLRGSGATDIVVLNMMSSSKGDSPDCFAPFERRTVDDVLRSRQLNLMLFDLARQTDVAIVDVDDIATQIGGHNFLAGMVHQNYAMEAAIRDEMMRVLGARGFPMGSRA